MQEISLIDLFSYGFIQRAVIAGSLIALLCSLIGVVLVLRRLSLIGDGLAHVTFGSAALALFVRLDTLLVSIPIVAASSVLILKLVRYVGVYSDAAIGIVSSSGIALGVILASIKGGFNVDLFSYLFGSILAINTSEVYVCLAIVSCTVVLFLSFYREILSLTFDEELAKVSGIRVDLINNITAVLTAMTVVLAMKLVGIMLTSALLIMPAVTAFQVSRSFKGALLIAAIVSVVSVNMGIVLSFVVDIPTGALTVLINLSFFVSVVVYKKVSAMALGHGR